METRKMMHRWASENQGTRSTNISNLHKSDISFQPVFQESFLTFHTLIVMLGQVDGSTCTRRPCYSYSQTTPLPLVESANCNCLFLLLVDEVHCKLTKSQFNRWMKYDSIRRFAPMSAKTERARRATA